MSQLFTHPIFPNQNQISKKFKESMSELSFLLKNLGSYTDNLQSKVDNLLKKQQQEFLKAYKAHLYNLHEAVKKFEIKIEEQSKKITLYENEGALSNVIKKSNSLEKELLILYHKYENKEKQLESYKLRLKISEKEQARLGQAFKEIIKSKQLSQIQNVQNNSLLLEKEQIMKSETTEPRLFATEVDVGKYSKEKLTKASSDSIRKVYDNDSILKQANSQETIRKRLEKQIQKLNKKNAQLVSMNVKSFSFHNELEDLFFNCVQTVKKNYNLNSSNLGFYTFEQFKKEDKLILLMMLLQNEQILTLIYQKLFGKPIQRNKSVFDKLGDKSVYNEGTNASQKNITDHSGIALKLPIIPNLKQKLSSRLKMESPRILASRRFS